MKTRSDRSKPFNCCLRLASRRSGETRCGRAPTRSGYRAWPQYYLDELSGGRSPVRSLAVRASKKRGTITFPGRTKGVRSTVLNGGGCRIDMRPEPVASSIVQAVATEDGAIGFASHFLAALRTKTLAVARAEAGPYVLPTVEQAPHGNYPLARRLFIYINRPPGAAVAPVCASSCASSAPSKDRKSPRETEIFRSTRRSRRANARSLSEAHRGNLPPKRGTLLESIR